LVDEVIAPALFDHAGSLCLTGTPGPVPAGYFYEASHNPAWGNFHWTMFDNPWLEKKSGMTVQALLERDLARKGVKADHPSVQREVFGRWVSDPDALVIKYNAELNHFDELPKSSTWNYVFGVDLGFDDSDAISVIGWTEESPDCYLVYEEERAKQGITELAQWIESLVTQFEPLRIRMDTGGLGKKIAEEIRIRFAIPIEAAEKVRKFEFIEILNDALRTGRFRAKKDGLFAQDSQKLEWERDPDDPSKLKIKDTFHSDVIDSTLYAYRDALHWLHEPTNPKPLPGTPAFQKMEEDEMEGFVANQLRDQRESTGGFDDWSSAGL
jgi:hypothetical protein